MNRRAFLALGGAGVLHAQRPAAATAPGAPMPPPPSARITSSVVLSTLKGTFEERVLTAAKAGIQSIELGTEYGAWDDAAIAKARRFAQAFHMGIDTIAGLPDDAERAIAIARKLNCPQILVSSVPKERPEGITFLVSDVEAVKQADDARVRLMVTLADGSTPGSLQEIVDSVAVFRVPLPGARNLAEMYRAIGKAGYSRYIALECAATGEPVSSLIHAADGFRAALMEKPLVVSN